MVINNDKPKLAVLQLPGGNDYLNTIIPYSNGLYYDNRPAVKVLEDQVLKLDNDFGLHPNMAPIKELYDAGKVAIVHGCRLSDTHEQLSLSLDGYLAHLRTR